MSDADAALDGLAAALATLRSQGAGAIAGPRLLQLEALARRLATQPPAVQVLLRRTLQAAVAQIAQQLADTAPAGPSPAMPDRIATRATRPARPSWPIPARAGELASASRFRRAWSRTRAQETVVQAAAQRPVNAGPLNSQLLLLHSLELMGQLSPDYLRRFVAHAEALLWLEGVPVPRAKARAARAPAPRRRRGPGAAG